MKRLRKILISFFIVILGALFLNINSFKSNKVFALVQGEDNYYYFYGDAKNKYYQMSYNEDTTRFEFNGEPYAMINATSSHPGINGDVIKFKVLGYGHGVGMSQTGADSMAKGGSSAEEIIKHFYSGVEIKTVNEL